MLKRKHIYTHMQLFQKEEMNIHNIVFTSFFFSEPTEIHLNIIKLVFGKALSTQLD